MQRSRIVRTILTSNALISKTCFPGVRVKQTRLAGEAREEEFNASETLPLCIGYIIPQHGTPYASKDAMNLIVFIPFRNDKDKEESRSTGPQRSNL